MDILTNETNLEPLKSAVKSVRKSIFITSAWVRPEILRQIIDYNLTTKQLEDIRSGKIRLRILMRLDQSSDIYNSNFAELIPWFNSMNAEVRFLQHIHAKVYLIDDTFAMFGSFNLSRAAFGGRNAERGAMLKSPDHSREIAELHKSMEELWDHPEVRPFDRSIIGMVLNPTSLFAITAVALRPMPLSQYVTIERSDAPERMILARVADTRFHSQWTPMAPDISPDNTNLNERFQNTPSGFADGSLGYAHSMVHSLENPNTVSWADLTPICEIGPARDSNGNTIDPFHRYPLRYAVIPGTLVREASADILRRVLFRTSETSIPADFATLISNPEIQVRLNLQEIATKHLAVYGSTGSGKSYFVKKFLQSQLWPWMNSHKGRVIIFDPHGEYARDLAARASHEIKDVKIIDASDPANRVIILETAEEITEYAGVKAGKDDLKILNAWIQSSDTIEDFILKIEMDGSAGKQKKKSVGSDATEELYHAIAGKIAHAYASQQFDFSEEFRSIVKDQFGFGNSQRDIEELNNRCEDLWQALTASEKKLYKSPSKDQITNDILASMLANRFSIDATLRASLLTNLKDSPVKLHSFDLVSKQMAAPGLYVIDLHGIHEPDERYQLAANIMTSVFYNKKENPRKEPNTIFLLEEAHNFAPEGGGKNNPAGRITAKIASEGRKFDIGLLLITQRPASVSKAVLTQMNSQATFRLNNPGDIGAVAAAAEGMGDAEVNQIARFQQGQGIFSGIWVNETIQIQVGE